MKSKRPAIGLHMVFLLTEQKSFSAEKVMEDLDISRSSFFRALSDFRCYLQEFRPEIDLVLDEKKGVYRLFQYRCA